MTDEEFAKAVDVIIAKHPKPCHSAHRSLDLLWTQYTRELPEGHPLRTATSKWMAHIEGDHSDDKQYPLPRVPWPKRPLHCKLGRHRWIDTTTEYDWGSVADCLDCGKHSSYGNPCP